MTTLKVVPMTNNRLVDLDAERGVLGSIIMDPGVLPSIIAILGADDFSTPQHVAIWSACLALRELDDPIDTVTLTAMLRGTGSLATAGGPAYLAELENDCSTSANAVSYAEILHDLSERRAQLEALRLRQAQLNDLDTPVDPARRSSVVPICDAVDAAASLFTRRHNGTERPLPLPWPGVSRALGGGLWPGAHVVTGTTAAGKTAFAIQVAITSALDGHPVLYIGLELDTSQIIARLASLVMGEANGRPVAHWSDIYLGKVAPPVDDIEKLRHLPFYVEEAPPGGWSARSMRSRVDALQLRHPGVAPLVVLDFLQLVGPSDPSGRREELRERIGAAAYAGREVARKCGAVVLMLSSISRNGATELLKMGAEEKLGIGDPADLVGLGKESGDIEFSADTVLVLAREPRKEDEPKDAPATVWLALAKQRAGRPAWALLKFNGSWLEEQAGAGWETRQKEREVAQRERAVGKAKKDEEEARTVILRLLAAGPMSTRDLRQEVPKRKDVVDRALAGLDLDRYVSRSGPRVGGKAQWALSPSVAGCGPSVARPHQEGCAVGSVARGPVGATPPHPPPPRQKNLLLEAPATLKAGHTPRPKLTPEERARLAALPPTDEYLEAMVARVEADSRADQIRTAIANGDDERLAELSGLEKSVLVPDDSSPDHEDSQKTELGATPANGPQDGSEDPER